MKSSQFYQKIDNYNSLECFDPFDLYDGLPDSGTMTSPMSLPGLHSVSFLTAQDDIARVKDLMFPCNEYKGQFHETKLSVKFCSI